MDALYPLVKLEGARLDPSCPMVDDGISPVTIGIDIAGPGEDETVAVVRCGKNLLNYQVWNEADPTKLQGAVLAYVNQYKDASG